MGQLAELFLDDDSKDRAYPIFYVKSVENKHASKRAGKPVYEDVEYVKIKTFDKTSENDCPVEDTHRQRWRAHYQRFKENAEAPIEGTPLTHWPPISQSKVLELNSLNVRSVEDLADFPEGSFPPRSNMAELKRMARTWLQDAKKSGVIAEIEADRDQLRAENKELKDTLAKLNARMEVLEDLNTPKDPPKKRGRPRKNP